MWSIEELSNLSHVNKVRIYSGQICPQVETNIYFRRLQIKIKRPHLFQFYYTNNYDILTQTVIKRRQMSVSVISNVTRNDTNITLNVFA